MVKERYDVIASPNLNIFEFESTGPKGVIKKVVLYSRIRNSKFYNLGFGDKEPQTGLISDVVITNNGDSKKVLATVAATLLVFTNQNPDAIVVATGSTSVRTRLYRMGISNNLIEIQKDFIVFGLINDAWEEFRMDIDYTAFLVKRKL